MTQERFTLTLEAIPRDSRPASLRLRGLLKAALRGFGLRCVTCASVHPKPDTTDEPDRLIRERLTHRIEPTRERRGRRDADPQPTNLVRIPATSR